MKRHIIVFSLILMSVGYNQDYEIDEYTFEWLVDEVRNVKIISIKINKKIKFILLYDINKSLQKKIKIEQLRKETKSE